MIYKLLNISDIMVFSNIPIKKTCLIMIITMFSQQLLGGWVITSDTKIQINQGFITSGDVKILSDGELLVAGDATILGTLTNEANNSGIGIFDDGSLLHLTPGVRGTVYLNLSTEYWHYIASPIIYGETEYFSTLNMGLTPGANNDQFYRWYEADNMWIDILNGEDGSGTNPLMDDEGFNLGQGYAIRYEQDIHTNPVLLSLSGILNSESNTYSVTNTGTTDFSGSNLTGNPYTSTIAANSNASLTDNFISQNLSKLDPTYSAVYLWDDIIADYLTINNSSDATYISPGQAFMIMAQSTDEIIFNTEIRMHGNSTFYKGNFDNPRLELFVTNPLEEKNPTSIYFIPGMSNGMDQSYDAGKLFGNPNLGLYTKLAEDNSYKLAVQALPSPIIHNTSVTLGLKTESEGIHKISVSKIENFQDGTVMLKDKITGITTDLNHTNEYSFVVNNGQNLDERFILTFKASVGVDDNAAHQPRKENFAHVINNQLFIHGLLDIRGQINIFNMTGQLVYSTSYISNNYSPAYLTLKKGYYIISISSKNYNLSDKIMIM